MAELTSAGIESSVPSEESPLELTINNEAFYLADTEPMGVVAEVIRNDMGDSLGIMVYDDVTRQVHKFRTAQLVVRQDGKVTVLPSWFKRSRDILRNVETMEDSIPSIKRARKKGMRLSDEEAAKATSDSPAEVQRFIDEAVILRSQLIGKLHGLLRKQEATDSQLKDLTSPGLFDRTSDEERRVQIATLKRSHRLNLQTINAMRDYLVGMDRSQLFPKDPRVGALFRITTPAAPVAPPEEEVAEFETFEEEEVAEFETFEEADEFETFEDVAEFEDVPEMAAVEEEVPLPPPPAAAGPALEEVEALPDADELTVSQPSLMAVGAPGWTPPQPGAQGAAPLAGPAAAPPPPPAATQTVPPPPMPSMEEFEASGQRKIDGEIAEPEPVAKKAGLLGRLRRGREKKEEAPKVAAAAVAGAAAGGAVAYAASQPQQPEEFAPVEDFAPVDEFETFEDVETAPATAMPPPPSLPPPPSYTPHAEALAIDSFQEVPPTDEFSPVQLEAQAPPQPASQAPPPQAPPPQAPPPQAPPPQAPPPQAPAPIPAPVPAPAPAPAPAPVPEETFETFEEADEFPTFDEEPGPGPLEGEPGEDRPLDAEKDIDAILAMALGKAPPPGSRPTAKPGVRESGSSMQSLLSKTKYRRND